MRPLWESFKPDDGTVICFASMQLFPANVHNSCGLYNVGSASRKKMLLLSPAEERWMCVVMPHYSNNMRWSLFTERSRLTCQTQSISVSTGTTLHKNTWTSLRLLFQYLGIVVLNCATVWTKALLIIGSGGHKSPCQYVQKKAKVWEEMLVLFKASDGHIKGFVSWAPHVSHDFPSSVSTQTAALC